MAHEIDTFAALWQNLEALMKKRYGEVNLSRFSSDCGFAQSTATRIKQQQTAIGLDNLDKIARAFGLATWQLLVPGMDPDNPPALKPVGDTERDLYRKLGSIAKEIVTEVEAGKYL